MQAEVIIFLLKTLHFNKFYVKKYILCKTYYFTHVDMLKIYGNAATNSITTPIPSWLYLKCLCSRLFLMRSCLLRTLFFSFVVDVQQQQQQLQHQQQKLKCKSNNIYPEVKRNFCNGFLCTCKQYSRNLFYLLNYLLLSLSWFFTRICQL